MSKSLGNTIDILAAPEVIRKQVMSMVTDTKRILRTDPGRPEVCNVCQLQPAFGDDYESLWEGERTARTGCVDMKKLLADRIIAHYAEARERYAELMDHPERVRRDPGRRRRAHPPDRRGDDGRGPGQDGPALSGHDRLAVPGTARSPSAEHAAHPRRHRGRLHRSSASSASCSSTSATSS